MTEGSANTPSYGQTLGGVGQTGSMHEAMGGAAEKVRSGVDSARPAVADKLRAAADTVRERASRMPRGEQVTRAAQGAADAIASSANYVRSHSAREMSEDLLELVKRNPTTSLLIAGGAGFLIAWALRRE